MFSGKLNRVQLYDREIATVIAALADNFIRELGNIYDAEHRFLEAQHMMLHHVTSDLLQSTLQVHISETEQQIDNLDRIFRSLGEEPVRINCEAASGIAIDSRKLMASAGAYPAVLDLVIAVAQSKIEHFEIACYRGLVASAMHLNRKEIAKLLRQNLNQEEQTAQQISRSLRELMQVISEVEAESDR